MEDSENKQLQRRFRKKDSFYRQMVGIAKKYTQFEQQALYCDIKGIRENMISKVQLKLENNNKGGHQNVQYFIIYGLYQPKGEKTFEKLLLQIIRTISKPSKPYGLIYVNTLAESGAYSDFKKTLQILPIEYYIHLCNFFSKASNWLSFGTISSFIKNKTIYTSSVQSLSEKSHIKYQILIQSIPQKILQELSKEQFKVQQVQKALEREKKKKAESSAITASTIPYKMLKQEFSMPYKYEGKTKPQGTQASKVVFRSNLRFAAEIKPEVPLNTSKNKNKFQMQQYEIGSTGAPLIIELLIYYFDNDKNALTTEGIFRKCVSIDDETEILKQLQKKNYDFLQSVTNPHLIANALKRFIYNFKTPIIPYNLFNFFMEKDADPNFNILVAQAIKNLPKIRKITLFILFDFLREKVIPCADKNKMTQNNLCIVMGPCIMSSQVSSFKDLIYAQKIIKVVSIIFKQFQSIFGSKKQQNQLLRQSYREHKRQSFLTKTSIEEKRISQQQYKQKQIADQSEDHEQMQQNKNIKKLLNKATLYVQKKLQIDSDSESSQGNIEHANQKEEQQAQNQREGQRQQQQKNKKINLVESKWKQI